MKPFTLPRLILLLLVALASMQTAAIADMVPMAAPSAKGDLTSQSYLLWQRINEARRNPRQAMVRLGIPEQTAVAALGSDAWLLDQGLPPLAWNGQLQTAALTHGRDMLTNLYYSHVSPTGTTPAARIAATGYEAADADETLAALVFDNYLATDTALAALFDNMLRDELTGIAGVGRNIFSATLSEIGIGFLAESVALLDGRPYVYLLVVDFSQPLVPRQFVVGEADLDSRLMIRNLYTGFWDVQPYLTGGAFQFQVTERGEEIFALDVNDNIVGRASTLALATDRNYFLDLRVALPAP